MSAALLPSYTMLWFALCRALLVRANILPPTCARCGLKFERRQLGDPICCGH